MTVLVVVSSLGIMSVHVLEISVRLLLKEPIGFGIPERNMFLSGMLSAVIVLIFQARNVRDVAHKP